MMNNVLSKTLAFFDSEAKEKLRQKHAFLQVRIVRDELSALTRKSDNLAQRYYSMKDRADPAMLDQLDMYEADISNLERKLKELQNMEVARREEVIESRACLDRELEEVDKESSSTTISSGVVLVPPVAGLVFKTPPLQHQTSTSPLTTVSTNKLLPAGQQCEEEGKAMSSSTTTATTCIECGILPTIHKCRRCKRLVCDLCCVSKRGLEMIWWCADCFDLESLTTQNQIRSGTYNSDDEQDDEDDDDLICIVRRKL
jgi:hypothetical protein